MSETEKPTRKPISIIQEIEAQLESYLRRQREEIEKTLEEKLRQERELARQQLDIIEQEVKKEWQVLEEYGSIWEEFEDKRQQVIKQIKEYLDRILERQQQIESLARANTEDLKAINELQDQLEEVHCQSMERANWLRKRMEEKFGLKTEPAEKAEEELKEMDLTPEIEKLRKIKELLLLESGASAPVSVVQSDVRPTEPKPADSSQSVPLAEIEESSGEGKNQSQSELAEEENQLEQEELSIESKLAEEIRRGIVEKLGGLVQTENSGEEKKQEELPPQSEELSGADRQDLEIFYRQETANGSGQIGFYQKGKKNILEAEEILNRMEEALGEAKKLIYKLNFLTAAKEKFYLKQELISHQEGLRRYLQRLLALVAKKDYRFPAFTVDILNEKSLKELLDLLSLQNWSLAEDLEAFEQKLVALKLAFKARTTPASLYFAALKKELEA